MTYEEAINKLNEPDSLNIAKSKSKGSVLPYSKLIIAPLKRSDLMEYMAKGRITRLDMHDARQYSTNDKYCICLINYSPEAPMSYKVVYS